MMDENQRPIPTPGLIEWSEFMETDRHIIQTQIGPIWISTVFLGVDHGHGMLYETMIAVTGEMCNHFINNSQRRYRTVEEARAGHQVVSAYVEQVLADLGSKLSDHINP